MDENRLISGAVQLLILLLAVSVHESAHAWTARRCGDPTGYEQGRVSLNPLRHLDLFGSLLLPLLLIVAGGPVFGWARPVPVDPSRVRSPGRDDILISVAGPLANLGVAAAATLVLRAVVVALGPEARQAAALSLVHAYSAAAEQSHFPLTFFLVQLAMINGFLALFNLLPVPPLDGGQILLRLMPSDWAQKFARIRPYGLLIVLGLAVLNLLTIVLLPIYLVLNLAIHW